jgi:hypothetical protein
LPKKYKMVTDENGKRHKLIIFNGAKGYEIRFPASCSGCHETDEGHEFPGTQRHPVHGVALGGGCDECGYRGFVIRYEWVPLNGVEFEKSCLASPSGARSEVDGYW